MISEIDGVPVKQCVGCGFCCRQAPCAMALRIYGRTLTKCPELVYHDSRWRCRAVEHAQGPLYDRYVDDVASGGGCSSTMFIEDRRYIPTPEEIAKREELAGISDEPLDYKRAFEVLVRQMVQPFRMSGDALWLTMDGLEYKMGKRAAAAFLRIARENRDRQTDEFMGGLEVEVAKTRRAS